MFLTIKNLEHLVFILTKKTLWRPVFFILDYFILLLPVCDYLSTPQQVLPRYFTKYFDIFNLKVAHITPRGHPNRQYCPCQLIYDTYQLNLSPNNWFLGSDVRLWRLATKFWPKIPPIGAQFDVQVVFRQIVTSNPGILT